jgi:hypothetical protein
MELLIVVLSVAASSFALGYVVHDIIRSKRPIEIVVERVDIHDVEIEHE